jgi:hypothetical protein
MLLPVDAGFDWETCFANVEAGEWYLVVFRCKHRADADEAFLTKLDSGATAAAMTTPGFLFYFAGVPCSTGECLSFCLWDQRSSAQMGSARPEHRTAVQQGVSSYEYYNLERHLIRKQQGQIIFTQL